MFDFLEIEMHDDKVGQKLLCISAFVIPPIILIHKSSPTLVTVKRLNASMHSLMVVILTLTIE